jgi:phosphohistidine swiveling domain-containing protein
MKYVTQLEKVHEFDLISVGGKAANLGELMNSGFPVPPGFVVLTSAYDSFVSQNNMQSEIERIAQSVSLTDPSTATQASLGIQELFNRAVLPEVVKEAVFSEFKQLDYTAVAVRSSATAEDLLSASFAGLQESILNVVNIEDLFMALRRCWSSLWTARALAYRARKHIASETVRMAVIVQQMVEATASGVLFTCNPTTGAQDEMVIDASWGLGEAIVSGHVTPDVNTLHKESGEIKFKEVAEKLLMTATLDNGVFEQAVPPELQQQPVLSMKQIACIHQLGLKIEERFRTPQDIEWAIADNKVFVLQARPITTRPSIQAVTVHQSELAVPGDDSWDRQAEPQAQLAALTFYLLERRVSKWTGKKGQATLLVQALSGVFTAEVGPAFWHMAHILRTSYLDWIVLNHPPSEAFSLLQEKPEAQPFITEFQAFLLRHGYRCPNDAELRHPRWAEAPEQVIVLIKSYLSMNESPNPVRAEQKRQQEREQLTAQIGAQLNPMRRRIFHWLLRQTQNKIRLRDNNRSYVAKFLFPVRLLIAELGRRWSAKGWLTFPDDIFFLTLFEIDDLVNSNDLPGTGKDLVTLVSKRKAAFDYWYTVVAPTGPGPGGIPLPDPEPTDSFLQGLPASSGRARGTARIVRSLEEATRLSEGDILVTQGTDPGWTPVFPLVSGLVLEVGGQLSHGAIIAREYGLPAVINVPGAMHFIQDGQTIEVDGKSGRVYLEITD